MFATTKQFLDYFNLKSLQDLPPLSEIKDLVKDNPELNLEDDLADQRILELPEEVVDENSIELSDAEKADLIAEEEAVALSKKPLDEILQLPPELQDPAELGDEADEEDDEDIEFSEEFGLKELDDTLDSLEAADDELAEVKTASEGEAEPAVNAEDEELLTGEDSEEVEFDAGENPGNT